MSQSESPEDADQAMRKKKQLFLIENVAEDGFDTSKFNMYLFEKKGKQQSLTYI